jgi:hypothetical protein
MLKPSDLPADLRERLGLEPKRHKYNVSPREMRTIDGITFDSKAEMHHYRKLKDMQAQGLIRYFLRQVPFHLPGNVVYRTDFMVVYTDGRIEYVDVKGMRTAMYKLKRKQVEALFPVKIVEVTKGRSV